MHHLSTTRSYHLDKDQAETSPQPSIGGFASVKRRFLPMREMPETAVTVLKFIDLLTASLPEISGDGSHCIHKGCGF
jgi:hypothetical protein